MGKFILGFAAATLIVLTANVFAIKEIDVQGEKFYVWSGAEMQKVDDALSALIKERDSLRNKLKQGGCV